MIDSRYWAIAWGRDMKRLCLRDVTQGVVVDRIVDRFLQPLIMHCKLKNAFLDAEVGPGMQCLARNNWPLWDLRYMQIAAFTNHFPRTITSVFPIGLTQGVDLLIIRELLYASSRHQILFSRRSEKYLAVGIVQSSYLILPVKQVKVVHWLLSRRGY